MGMPVEAAISDLVMLMAHPVPDASRQSGAMWMCRGRGGSEVEAYKSILT